MAMLNWHLVVCGISHKSSTIEERASLQINRENIARANKIFKDITGVKESAILATCNRIEFYFVAYRNRDPFEIIIEFFRNYNGYDVTAIKDKFYIRKNKHTADHLFRVASGIDSMILGENQIIGQMKDTYSSACAVRAAGKIIHRLFHQSFRVGKIVRTDTEMGKGSCSVSSAAMDLLKDKIDKLEKPNILFIGVNKMIALAASSLARGDYGQFVFANRTAEKSVALADTYGGVGCGLDQIDKLLAGADIVITCTGSEQPIISISMLKKFVKTYPNKKTIFLDMAVPRDIESGSWSNKSVVIYDLEDINRFVRGQQAKREKAIPQAEEIIDRKLSEFIYWFDHVRQEPIYNGLGDAFDEIYQKQMGSVLDKLEPELRQEFDKAGRKMIREFLMLKVGNDGEK